MTVLFILFFIVFPVMALQLLRVSGFSVLQVGLPQFVVTLMFLLSFFGTLPLFFGWDEYRAQMGLNDRYLVFKIMMASGFSMITLLLGSFFSKTILSRSVGLSGLQITHVSRRELLALFFVTILVLFVLRSYLSQISNIALLVALFEPAGDVHEARSSMGNNFAGRYHWYSLIIHDFAYIVSFSFFALYLKVRGKFQAWIFGFSFAVCSFTSLMATEKGPFAWYLIGLGLTYVLVKKSGRYPIKWLLFFGLLLLWILSTLSMSFMGVEDPIQAIVSIFSRVFAGSIHPAYYYLEFFPEHHEFLWGLSFPNPGGVFPYTPYSLTTEMAAWAKPDLALRGIVGSMPTVFWAEAYANFSWLGVAFVPFLWRFTSFC